MPNVLGKIYTHSASLSVLVILNEDSDRRRSGLLTISRGSTMLSLLIQLTLWICKHASQPSQLCTPVKDVTTYPGPLLKEGGQLNGELGHQSGMLCTELGGMMLLNVDLGWAHISFNIRSFIVGQHDDHRGSHALTL